jgi:hypothetical protein
VHATCSVQSHPRLDHSNYIWRKIIRNEAPCYAFFSILLLFHSTSVQILYSAPCSQTLSVYVRSEVCTAANMKNIVFWVVILCTSCVNRRFGEIYRLHLQGRKFLVPEFFYPEDGRETLLRNVGSHKIYTAPHPRSRHSSPPVYVPPLI